MANSEKEDKDALDALELEAKEFDKASHQKKSQI
jgi:hypothetical protein